MAAPPPSALDANQVLQHSFDDAEGRLRVDATFSGTVGEVVLKDLDGDFLEINPNGSLNTNILNPIDLEISAADGDNIAISDGTNTVSVNANGSINVEIATLPMAAGAATEAKQDVQVTELQQLNTTAASSDATLTAIDLALNNVESSVVSIDAKFPVQGPATAANSIPVTLATDVGVQVELDAFTNPEPDNVQLVGSIDGTRLGTKYGFVNNIRQQILATQDRTQDIFYADFGTKNQRITQIDYQSSVFPGIIARKAISYTLVGTRYRRDSIYWSIV
jgi:hypothetical protein